MSKWITDRRPTEEDALNGYIMIWSQCYREAWLIKVYDWHGAPWMPIPKPKPYVAHVPKFIVRNDAFNAGKWTVLYDGTRLADNIPTQEAAERIAAAAIAAIYNEVMK